MGSGSVGVAAAMNGRSFWGNDLCKEAVEITRTRLLETGAREVDTKPKAVESPQLGLL